MSPVRWAGVIGPKKLAEKCMVCSRWLTLADRIRALCGVTVSHGLCPDCEEAWKADLIAMDEAS